MASKDAKKEDLKDTKKVEKKEESKEKTNEEKTTKRRKRRNKKVEGYKRRNRLVEIIIVCVIIIFIFALSCNKTFLKTNYTAKLGNNHEISIDLPRFTYFVKKDDNKIVFKTLRKSTNTREFFNEFLENGAAEGAFEFYYCGDKNYYYNTEGKYVIYSIDVTKKFAVKTITVNYGLVDENTVCGTQDVVLPEPEETDNNTENE